MKSLIILFLLAFSFSSLAEENTSNRVFSLGGVLPIGEEGELIYIGPDCKEIHLFTSDWEVDQDFSFSELSYKTRISGSTKVKKPLTRYHISLVPRDIEELKRERYLREIESFLKQKTEAEGKRVKRGEVDAKEALFYGKCLKTPLKISLVPAYALAVEFGLNLFADSYEKSIFLTERYGKPVVELDIEVNPLEDRGRVHSLVESNEIGQYLKVDARSSSIEVVMEGFLTGSYKAFSEFEKKTYQEKTCWTTRSCRKFGPFKYSCRNHHHCRYYPVVKTIFKQMSASNDSQIYLAAADTFTEKEKDEFTSSLLAKFIMTNFNGQVSAHNSNLLVYKSGALKREANVRKVIAQRISTYVEKNSTLMPFFEKSTSLESREIDSFINSEKFKCLIENGLTEIKQNGPCK
ncbi:MAG: hypothetical protein KC493_17560 [Bacteriovoracaceae bacterium]|nr:hypothetical protein [Bacteriovoracaceae bacterium]